MLHHSLERDIVLDSGVIFFFTFKSQITNMFKRALQSIEPDPYIGIEKTVLVTFFFECLTGISFNLASKVS